MATITVPDALMARLAPQAAQKGLTVDELVAELLDESAWPPMPTPEQQLRSLEEWRREIQSRADFYPPGFRADDDRESIYREREDAQL